MKVPLRLTSLLLTVSAFCADTPVPIAAEAVTVERLSLSIPTDAPAAAEALWAAFANKPAEQKFAQATVHGWRQTYSACTAQLLKKAAESAMEASSLKRVLEDIDRKRGSLAVLPIGAYRATQGAKAVWIVVCKWESESMASNPSIRLGHIRIFAYDVGTIEQVAFKTCL